MGLLSKIAKKKFKKKPKSLVSRFPKKRKEKRKSGGLFGSAIRKILEERQQIQPISIGNIIENELPRRGGFLKRIARRNIPNFIAREIDQDSISPLQNAIEKLRNSEKPQLIERIEVKPVEFDPITSIGKSKEDRLQFLKDKGIEIPPNFLTALPPPRNPGSYDSIGMPLLDRRNMPEGVRGGRRRRFNEGGVAATMAITQGPDGQMYTDGSMQTPYNPPQQMYQNTGGMAKDMMVRGQATGFDGNPIRNFGPQRGIGSFQNPFGGFMGGGRGQFMRPQPPMYGGGFGMQPPMFGGGMNYGMPPMFGGGMYGGGFGMQPPMYGGGFGMMRPIYGGGFGSPFSPGFGGGIGGMFPGIGGGYGMRPPMYGGGYNRPMPQPMPQPIRPAPQPIRPMPQPIRPMPIDRPRPMPQPIRPIPIDRPRPIKRPMPEPMPIMQTQGPDNIGGGRPFLQRVETKGPGNLMRQRGGPIPLADQQMAYPF